jgi:hypothetical protein
LISKDEFWGVMEAYGAGIMPVQIVFYIAAILIVGWYFFKPGRTQTLIAKLYLAMSFTWTGIMFYFVLARDMAGDSYGNTVFGAIFILVAVLFAVDLFRGRMQFSPSGVKWQQYVTLVFLVLVLCYPMFGLALGHRFPGLIMPGTFPCPTTALALLLLTTALPRVDKLIYILLLICAIPFTPFVQIARYGVLEDAILFSSGVYSLILLLKQWNDGGPLQPEK